MDSLVLVQPGFIHPCCNNAEVLLTDEPTRFPVPREHIWSQMFILQFGSGLGKCPETAATAVPWLPMGLKPWLSSGKKLPQTLHRARTSTRVRTGTGTLSPAQPCGSGSDSGSGSAALAGLVPSPGGTTARGWCGLGLTGYRILGRICRHCPGSLPKPSCKSLTLRKEQGRAWLSWL